MPVVQDNRRLANSKTKQETGLDYVLQSLELNSPFGKKALKEIRPFYPGDEDALCAELDRVELMRIFASQKPALVSKLSECFMEMKDASLTLERSANQTLSAVELFEIKSLLLQMRQVLKITKDFEAGDYNACSCVSECKSIDDTRRGGCPQPPSGEGPLRPETYAPEPGDLKIPPEYILENTEDVLDILDPRNDRMNTFYIYDEFSPLLAELRKQKRDIELKIRQAQKGVRDELRKREGVSLTPKFDLVVARSHPDFEKIKNIPELEVSSEDYNSVSFILKPGPEVYGLIKEIEEINTRLDEEEERIRAELSRKIAANAERIAENCRRIGQLELALAKALLSIKRRLTKPEIIKEHFVKLENARNLQVEEILKKKGKEYCPISIELRDGVTLITGANMGGKTISLKLIGQAVLMAQYGLFVPAEFAQIGLTGYMQMLIGDSQSVDRGLSSFGSEMEELKEILDRKLDRSLIMMDEIASGTNPSEGTALTKSIVSYLMDKPCISVITTHFETVTDIKGVVNMQVKGLAGTDFELLQRKIRYANRRERINIIAECMDYRLVRVESENQIPKDALNIAAMLGISKEIIDGAKNYLR